MPASCEATWRNRGPTSASAGIRLGASALGALLVAGVFLACSAGDPEPNVDTLRDSFTAVIESIDLVKELEVEDDEIRFVRPDGSGDDVDWRVRIESLAVESAEGEGAQVLGHVLSAWSANGRPISVGVGPDGRPVTDMPAWVLDTGLATECWALWDPDRKQWGW